MDDNILLEQYKIYVEMADRISSRRSSITKFYISILSVFLAILAFVFEKNIFTNQHNFIVISISIMGVIINILWIININAYRLLNTAKFKIIHEMEDTLAFPCYKKEWEILGEGKNSNKQIQLTLIERFIPIIFTLPFILAILVIFVN